MSAKNITDLVKLIQEKDPTFKPNLSIRSNFAQRLNELCKDYSSYSALEFKPMEHAIYPILPHAGLMMVFAASGVGKTYFTLNLAGAMATGRRFLNYEAKQPRRVAYIDGEMRKERMQERQQILEPAYGDSRFINNLYFISSDLLVCESGMTLPKITDEAVQQEYEQHFLTQKYDVVIFDNLSSLAILDENSSSGWQGLQDWFMRLRSLGFTVIVVHHTGKNKDSYRGTSRMLDILDTAILLKHEESTTANPLLGTYRYTVHYEKHREFFGQDALSMDIFSSGTQWAYQPRYQSIIDQVLALKNDGLTQTQIAKEAGVNQSTVSRIFKKHHI